MLRNCIVLSTFTALGVVQAGAQAQTEVVLLQCGAYRSVAQSSDGAPTVDRNANCAEELRRILAAGYTLSSVGSGDAPAPFFTLVGPLTKRQSSPRPRSVDAAVLMCDWDDYRWEYNVAVAGVSSGTGPVGTGAGTHCANETARLLSAGFSLAQVRVGKDSTETLFIVLTRVPETAAAHSRRARGSRRVPVVHTTLVSCQPWLRSPVEISATAVSSSDAQVPAGALAAMNCGQAVSELLENGYFILDVQTGESWGPIVVTLSKK